MKYNWKQLFRNIILERGEDYYYGGLVSDLKKEDFGYSAVVKGNEDYEVNIFIENDKVTEMDCDCPYACDGNNCKHMAAVLYAIDEGPLEELPGKPEDINDILASMSDEDVRKELYEIIENNREIRDHIYNLYRKSSFTRTDIYNFKRSLEELAYDHGDRYGFVDWRNGRDHVDGFSRCLEDYVEPMMTRREYLNAFEALKQAFEVINNVEMDGSNGEYSMVEYSIEDYFKTIIESADENEKDVIHDWFSDLYVNQDEYILSDLIENIYENSFNDEKYLYALLDDVKERLDNDEEGYLLEHDLKLYRNILDRLGKDDSEYENWLRKHEDNVTVIRIRLDQAEQNDNVDEMIRILTRMCEDDRFFRNDDYHRKLLKLYVRNNDSDKQKSILKAIVFEDRYSGLDDIYALKELCNEDEWIKYRNRIINKYEKLRLEIYFREEMYKELAESLKNYPIGETDKYAKYLENDYRELLLKRYIKYLLDLADRHPSRQLYDEQYKYCLIALKYDEKGKNIKQILDVWKLKYPNRKVMQEMIRELENKVMPY